MIVNTSEHTKNTIFGVVAYVGFCFLAEPIFQIIMNLFK